MPYYFRGPLVSYAPVPLHTLTRGVVAHFSVIQTISAVWQKNWFHSRIVYICKCVKVAWFSVCTVCLAPNISQIFFLLSLPHCTCDDWNGSEIRIILKPTDFPGMCWSTLGGFLSETPVGFLIFRTSLPLPNHPPTDAKSQENTVPATEAASATVEDVGSGLVGDFVARWWITWFLFVKVWFVNNTFEG